MINNASAMELARISAAQPSAGVDNDVRPSKPGRGREQPAVIIQRENDPMPCYCLFICPAKRSAVVSIRIECSGPD